MKDLLYQKSQVNFSSYRSYQRKNLRAPYHEDVIIGSKDKIFKAKAFNISRGGLLLNNVISFPKDSDTFYLLLKICRYPYFKNFDFEKLVSYSSDLFKAKVVRVKCQVVRRQELKSDITDNISSNIGMKFLDLSPFDSETVNEYVDIFSSNLIYLQTLIDSLNQKPDKEKYVRELAKILGYDKNIKIALLNKYVIQDYRSLQWL